MDTVTVKQTGKNYDDRKIEERDQKRLQRKAPDEAELMGRRGSICGRPRKVFAGLIAHSRVIRNHANHGQ